MFQYRVQSGDTIYAIADYFDVSVAAILAANTGLLPHHIFPGQIILIPISRNLRQNYPWYYLLPYLFIRQPRRYWDDRRRWPRDWRDRDRRDRRGDRDRWDGRDRRSGRDRRDGRDRRGSGRRYLDNWNHMLSEQTLSNWEYDQWNDMNERNDIDGVPGMQPDILEQELEPRPITESDILPWDL